MYCPGARYVFARSSGGVSVTSVSPAPASRRLPRIAGNVASESMAIGAAAPWRAGDRSGPRLGGLLTKKMDRIEHPRESAVVGGQRYGSEHEATWTRLGMHRDP